MFKFSVAIRNAEFRIRNRHILCGRKNNLPKEVKKLISPNGGFVYLVGIGDDR